MRAVVIFCAFTVMLRVLLTSHPHMSRPGFRLPLALLVWLLFAVSVSAAPNAPPQRPKIGLVLGGGGALGISHIGVIKVLEQMRIPIDYVAGTSMGSLVGGAYASGMSPEEMERRVRELDWAFVFRDLPPRKEFSLYRKQLQTRGLWALELGLDKRGLQVQGGALFGQRLGYFLDELAHGAAGAETFDQLEMPFRAIATDAETGEMVVFDRGDLAKAMRASMSVPGAFAPEPISGRIYLDGGLVRNLPVDIVRQMGADVVIVVNLAPPPLKQEDLGNLLTVTLQMVNILIKRNVREQLATVTPADVLIEPDLTGYSSASFDKGDKLIPIGQAAAEKMAQQLARYSLPENAYEAFRSEQRRRVPVPRPVDAIDLDLAGLKRVNPARVAERLALKPGETVSPEELNRRVDLLYGTGDFERISYRFEERDGKRVLVVLPVEKPWGPNYLRFGLKLSSDFEGEGDFTLLGNYTMTWLNRLGAELRNDVGIGRNPFIQSEFYQPLTYSGRWFVAPRLYAGEQLVDFFQGNDRIAQLQETRLIAGIDAGVNFFTYGQIRAGLFTGHLHAVPNISLRGLETVNAGLGGVEVSGLYDRLDSAAFPRDGWYARGAIQYARPELGSESSYRKADLSMQAAWSYGRNTFSAGLRGGTSFGTELPFYELYSLGGFLNLSGYRTNQFQAQSVALGRVMYYRRIAGSDLLGSVYVGLSLEAGKVFQPFLDAPVDEYRTSGAVFLGADSILGPAYLAFGHADDGSSQVYFYLGLPY